MVLKIDPNDRTWAYKSLFGTQVLAQRRSAPQWKFGTSPLETLTPGEPSGSPQILKLTDRPQSLNSPHKTCLAWGASKLPRDCTGPIAGNPGPGRYTTCLSQVIGTQQPLASMPNSPRFSWTHASSRESNQATYVSRYHERENYGKHSPGPHTVGRQAFNSCGMQVSSQRPSRPRFAAVKERRFFALKASDTSKSPGPGSYDI
uniref:Uncharacterized protein n=1 Tax=Chlamydomonas leiostraca TaxID=1034604 RepID=A0A7S0S452_9CHLO|mmetsp:Transcript_6737/g.16772  ORF Transcript_6737/g.16772 Transcript_6737/m.16772 type:complete len:203 (+) Transcript_6737:104-712(+)